SIAVDGEGDVLVTGEAAGNVDFGGGPLGDAGIGFDIFVVKLDSTGSHLWSKRFGDAANQGGAGIAVDAAGGVLVTGFLAGTADFGGGSLPSKGSADVFVAKLDADGGYLWANRFGDLGDQQGMS